MRQEWRTFGGPGLAFGGDYNPEQWPRHVWREDVALMREAGVTFVSLGIFAWARVQPAPDRWDFGWLDEVMDLLAGNGVTVALATGTASPPPWFSHAHPETLPRDEHMNRLWPGSRQAWCPSSSVFTDHATAVVERLAQRYRAHPALGMWHVSNEYGCHNTPCYCDVCAEAFRLWLTDRYGDVDGLNDAWGTDFWSQRYQGVAEVLPPRATPAQPNPTQVLDYRRFNSDMLLSQYRAEADVLRRITPDVPVTTNFITVDFYRTVDYPAWVPHEDLVSTDHYATVRDDPEAELAFGADLTRGLAGGRPWLLMEHATSAVNWQRVNPAKAPGQMLRHSLGYVARGADGVGFFQWRASRAGAEKYHSAMVPHAGTGTRLWRELVHLGDVARRLGEVRGSTVTADVAMLWDYQAGWACDQESHPSSLVRYGDAAQDLHGTLRDLGVTVDVVPPGTDLTGYRLVLVPTLYLCTDRTVADVTAAVSAGVHALVTYFSGIVDEHDHIRLGGYPGAFRDLLGLRVEEFHPLLEGQVVSLAGDFVEDATATCWSEPVDCVEADPVLRYVDGPVPGHAAVTRRALGNATVWYVASRLDGHTRHRLLSRVCDEAGVSPATRTVPGVEVARRVDGNRSWLFVINHTREEAELSDVHGHDLVGDRPVAGLKLAPGAVAVVREAEVG